MAGAVVTDLKALSKALDNARRAEARAEVALFDAHAAGQGIDEAKAAVDLARAEVRRLQAEIVAALS